MGVKAKTGFVVIMLCFHWYPCAAQTLKCNVIDEDTGEGLGYASVIVLGKNIGGITSGNGDFEFDLAGAEKSDTVRFSYLGYHSLSLLVGSIDITAVQVIRLKPKFTTLKPVSVLADINTKALGNMKAGKFRTGWGDFQSLRGRTRGLLIQGAECPVRVKSLSFHIDDNEWDSVAFRINFFSVENDKPAESILHQNILFSTSEKHRWVKADLSQYNITICEKAIVALEWVDAWGKVGEFSKVLTFSLSNNDGYSYQREANQEFGTLVREERSPAMFIEVYAD
jgi:hypothetical protein